MFKVLVCGGREFEDYAFVKASLDDLFSKPFGKLKTYFDLDQLLIVQGDASGADRLALKYAQDNEIAYLGIPAPFKRWKERYPKSWRSAGPLRNKKMLDFADPYLVIAFPGGRGTANMVKQARERGIEVREIKYET